MKKNEVIRQLFVGACVRFTVYSLLLISLKMTLFGGSSDSSIHLLSFLLLFPCAVCVSAAKSLKSASLHPAVYRLFHFLIVCLSFFLFVWIPTENGGTLTRNLVALIVIVLLYWVILFAVKFIRSRFHGIKEETG